MVGVRMGSKYPSGTRWLEKNESFQVRISSVNVTKSAASCGFGHIYWRNPYWKTSFFVQWSSATSKKVPQPEEKMSNRDQRKNVRRLKKRLKETKIKKTVQI